MLKLFRMHLMLSIFVLGCSMSDRETKQEQVIESTNLSDAYLVRGLEREQLTDAAVLTALKKVPRHKFVPEEYQEKAYEDSALPIGAGQTISQPFIVALMTQEAQIRHGNRVLEIGTGSGYQAAVLSELGAKIFSVEIIPELAQQAQNILTELGYSNVQVRLGDGWAGWPEEAPFDAIIVTASTPQIPQALIEQIADGGRIVFPQEHPDGMQLLTVLTRQGTDLTSKVVAKVKFVPMTGKIRD